MRIDVTVSENNLVHLHQADKLQKDKICSNTQHDTVSIPK